MFYIGYFIENTGDDKPHDYTETVRAKQSCYRPAVAQRVPGS